MTEPTQAQKDAAAKAIQDGFPSFEADAEAAQQVANVALTAAAGISPTQAQVEAIEALLPGYEQYLEWCAERGVLFIKHGRENLEKAKAALAALTAAAGAAPEPTEAQIDAATKTAAEMVNGGNFNDPLFYSPEQKDFWRRVIQAALTAAAGVKKTQDNWKVKHLKAIENTTVERCALYAKKWIDEGGPPALIHFAIRSLGEKR